MSTEDRYQELRREEEAARDRLVAAWADVAAVRGDLRYALADMAVAITERESARAVIELRKINQLLDEHGYNYPHGAAGVADVFTHMGEVQLYEEEVPVALQLLRLGLDAADEVGPLDPDTSNLVVLDLNAGNPVVRAILAKLERVTGEQT